MKQSVENIQQIFGNNKNITKMYGKCECSKRGIAYHSETQRSFICKNCKYLLCKRHIANNYEKCVLCDIINFCETCGNIPSDANYFYCPFCNNICCEKCLFLGFMCMECLQNDTNLDGDIIEDALNY